LTLAGITRAIGYFEQSVARDPEYTLAYAGMAECYAILPISYDVPVMEILPKALSSSARAVQLDDSLAEAHASVGAVKVWMEWDWEGAEAALRRAIDLNPSYLQAHWWYAVTLSAAIWRKNEHSGSRTHG